ncbi:MAG: hypothetical protein H7Z71_06685 [Moraxellaceae bacterium]|nr:hypothetical protein [Pseudobdellovibrionaceae bacterium]
MQNNRLKLIETTQDGSPTLRMDGNPDNLAYTEQMHYSTGAASETIYVYGEAIKKAQAFLKPSETHYLVVGLGLGYIEILIDLLTSGDFKQIVSFEKDEGLIENFSSWCALKKSDVHDHVINSLIDQLKINISIEKVKTQLKNKLQIYPALQQAQNVMPNKFNVICYDAFSSKMDSKLWEFHFLDQFIKEHSAPICVFASYSKTGALNRALKQNGFKLFLRKGFSTKRECTLAIKA